MKDNLIIDAFAGGGGASVVPAMAQKLVEANCGYLKVGNRAPSLRLDMSEAQIKFA